MKKSSVAVAALTAFCLTALVGCGGTASESAASDQGDGVEYGASKEEYQEALADMEQVELIYQAGGSPSGHTADRERAFAESIEEWSGGKISIEPLFGQPIVPFGEILEAVADGRVDIGLEIPIYDPSQFPAMSDLSAISAAPEAGPLLAEMVHIAAAHEVAWDNEIILDEVRKPGVDVLVPAEFEFSNALICPEPVTSPEDFKGKQIRAGSATDFALIESLGASGVSLQLGEVFEALQRGVIDCAIISLKIAAPHGLLEAAPHVMFPSETSWGRSSTALVTGPKVAQLPLAARQLIFDMAEGSLGGQLDASSKWTEEAASMVEEFGGEFHRIDSESEQLLNDATNGLVTSEAITTLDAEQISSDFDNAYEKWSSIAEEEGFYEFEDWKEMAEHMAENPLDFDPFAKRMYEEIYLQHRPQQ